MFLPLFCSIYSLTFHREIIYLYGIIKLSDLLTTSGAEATGGVLRFTDNTKVSGRPTMSTMQDERLGYTYWLMRRGFIRQTGRPMNISSSNYVL